MSTTYSNLQADIRAWLARDELSDAQVQSFISMAEARINRFLSRHGVREMETVTTLTATQGASTIDLPNGFKGLRSLRITGSGYDYNLEARTPEQMGELYNSATGKPRFFTVQGSVFQFDRPFDAADSLKCVYLQAIAALSDSNTTNWLTENAQDILLFGSLTAAEAFNQNDERILVWKTQFDEGLRELIAADKMAKYGPAPVIRTETATP